MIVSDGMQLPVVPAALNGSAIIGALKEANVEFVVAVPDIWTSAGLLWPLSKDPDLRLIRLCKEDEGVSICSALAYCNRRAVLSMQSTGLLDSLNAIRAIAVEYEQPVCMLVGLLGRNQEKPLDDTQIYSVRIVPKLLDTMNVDYVIVDGPDDVRLIAPAIDAAYARSRPVVILIARPVTVP
jgi:sulfopyruvate decarboxylase subunit alpha